MDLSNLEQENNADILEMDGYMCACNNSLGCNMPPCKSVKTKMEWMEGSVNEWREAMLIS